MKNKVKLPILFVVSVFSFFLVYLENDKMYIARYILTEDRCWRKDAVMTSFPCWGFIDVIMIVSLMILGISCTIFLLINIFNKK